MKTPNQQVSDLILNALREKDLLADESLKGFSEKMAGGKMLASDWKMLFKLDAVARKKHGEDKA